MKTSAFLLVVFLGMVSCVPAKQYDDLQSNLSQLGEENEALRDSLDQTRNQIGNLRGELSTLKADKENFGIERQRWARSKEALDRRYQDLYDAYAALEENSSSAQKENAQQNRALLAEIDKKRHKLNEETLRLAKMKRDLELRGNRIDELEKAIEGQKRQMKELKDHIASALTDFEGKGLHVHEKDGKVYVSMENKLLFPSGSWEVNAKGKEAVRELGKVLAQNPDIHVLIEGHTDNVPYKGSGSLQNNWDLSTKRATAVVNILMDNKQINPKNLTAAGRSKYDPLVSNQTAEGRAKNRRIEVILTPELGKLNALLEGSIEGK